MADDTKKRETVESEDSNGNKVTVVVRPPTAKDKNGAQLQYLKSFRQALESGAILKQKLDDHLQEQGVWDEAKQKEYEKVLKTINEGERKLQKGGIKLEEAKDLAFSMKEARLEFRALIAERSVMDANTAESQADNASFDYLASVCIIDSKNQPIFSSLEEYQDNGDEPYVAAAAGKLAEKLYKLDPNYDKGLPENEFLVKYKFADEELRLINKDGSLVDDEGRFVNEEGRFVDEEGNFVDAEGNPVTEEGKYNSEFSPFLDDDGNPIVETEEEPEVTGDISEDEEEVAKKAVPKKKKKVAEKVEAEASEG
ncbi:hypothetical protein CL634_00465 [bacterium]|nr:hypothetical protein [bacterium]